MRAQRKIVLAIGLPGAGKSTHFARRGIRPLSSDLIRQLLYDDPSDQRHPEWVFGFLRELLRRRLASGARITYIDATNLTRRQRRPFLMLARKFGCGAEALFFDVPLEICRKRNRSRGAAAQGGMVETGRVVPDAALRRMAGELEPPARSEGFSRIRVVQPGVEKWRGRLRRNNV